MHAIKAVREFPATVPVKDNHPAKTVQSGRGQQYQGIIKTKYALTRYTYGNIYVYRITVYLNILATTE